MDPTVPPVVPSAAHRHTVKNRVQSKQDFIIRWLQDFYNLPGNFEKVLPFLSDSTTPVSHRDIDWFVTNYSKKFNISYPRNGRQFMVHFNYKRELKAYSKRLFDPFCRRERISFQIRGQPCVEETTVGQLNFFRWALETGVLDYILEHATEIAADHKESLRTHYSKSPEAKTPTGRRKRKEMSHSSLSTVSHISAPVTVFFS